MTQKREENIPKVYFCIRTHTFSTHMPCPFKICFTNKVNAICGGGQLLVTGWVPRSHYEGPGCQDVPCPRVASPKAQGSSSRVPGSHVSGSQCLGSQSLGSQGPGSQGLRIPGSRVSGPDFRLCHFSHVIKKNWRISVFKKQKSHTHQEKKKRFYPFIPFLFTPKQ